MFGTKGVNEDGHALLVFEPRTSYGLREDGPSRFMPEKCKLTRRKFYTIRRFAVLTPGKLNVIAFRI